MPSFHLAWVLVTQKHIALIDAACGTENKAQPITMQK